MQADVYHFWHRVTPVVWLTHITLPFQSASHLCTSPPTEFVYNFEAEGGANVTANCTDFSEANATPDITCPGSYVFFGRTSTPHHTCRDVVCLRLS